MEPKYESDDFYGPLKELVKEIIKQLNLHIIIIINIL